MLERVYLIHPATLPRVKTVKGKSICFISSRNFANPTKSDPGVDIADTGNTCKSTASHFISKSPKKKDGIEIPNNANTVKKLSKPEYCFVADTIPIGTAIITPKTKEVIASLKELGIKSFITELTLFL